MRPIYDLDQHVETFLHKEQVPGLALAVVQGEEVIYAQGYGVRSVEDAVPVTPETLFRIASTTKPLTGMTILRLVEEGKLDLDCPIAAYDSLLRLSEPEATEQVTLRMLLSHTAGLPTRSLPSGRRDPQALVDWVREELPLLPLIAPAGKVFSYSNPGIDLAGYLAQRVSGIPYTDLVARYVFGPLQMHRSTFDPLVAMTYPLAQSHIRPDGKTLQVQHHYMEHAGHHPSGYAISTVLDLAQFAIMHLHDGHFKGQQVLSATSVRAMHTPQTRLYTPSEAGYGLTLRSENYKGMHLVSHDGDVNSFNSRFLLIPETKLAIILLSNWFADLGTLSLHLLDDLLELPHHEAEPQRREPEGANWSRYIGSYMGRLGLAKVSQEQNHLLLDLNGESCALHSYSKDIFFGSQSSGEKKRVVGFVPEEEGPCTYLVLDGYFCHKRFDETSLSAPDPSLWAAFEGSYTASFETWTVRIHQGQLTVKDETFGYEGMCSPLDRMRFTWERGLLEFREVEQGKARQLILQDANPFLRLDGE